MKITNIALLLLLTALCLNAADLTLLQSKLPAIKERDILVAGWLQHQFAILERLQQNINTDQSAGNAARTAGELADYDLLVKQMESEINRILTAPDLKAQGTLDIRDFGAAGDGKTDDTLAIRRAIDTALAGKIRTVVIPKGDYRIKYHPELTVDFNAWPQNPVTDDHHPRNSGALVIMGKDLQISGEPGARLLIDSPQESAIHIIKSDNIRISDLQIDYISPLIVNGVIIATGNDYVDVETEPGAGDPLAPYFTDRGFKGLLRFYSEGHLPDGRPELSNDAIHQSNPEVTKIGDRRYRFKLKQFLPASGRYRTGQHISYYARSWVDHAIFNYMSSHTRLERIKLTASPAVAFYNFDSEMPIISDCTVESPPGQYASTCADALYFKTGIGGYVVGNIIRHVGDDFINIHGRLAPVVRQEGNAVYIPAKIWPEQLLKSTTRVGLLRSSLGESNISQELTLQSYELILPADGDPALVKLVFAQTIPRLADNKTAAVPDNLSLPDREWQGLVIDGNTFEHGVSRVLLGGRNIDITNNRFSDSLNSHTLIFMAMEPVNRAGGEARFPRNLLIRGNRFDSYAKTVLSFDSRINPGLRAPPPGPPMNAEHILFTDNDIRLYGDGKLPVIKIMNVDDLEIIGNRIESANKIASPAWTQNNALNVTIKDNTVSDNFEKMPDTVTPAASNP